MIIANQALRAWLAIINSYPTSASGIDRLIKKSLKYKLFRCRIHLPRLWGMELWLIYHGSKANQIPGMVLYIDRVFNSN